MAIHRNKFYNPQCEKIHREDGPTYTLNDIYTSTRTSKDGIRDRANKAAFFLLLLQTRRAHNQFAPNWNEIRNNEHTLKRFCALIETYIQYLFNITYNFGNSLEADLTAVKYVCACNGIHINNNDLKWWKRVKNGCNNICRLAFARPPGRKKRALFNPMVEHMLEIAGNDNTIRLGILLAHRFCLRAQHYVKTSSKADTMTYGSLYFQYGNNNEVLSLTYRNCQDKNHPIGSHEMDRTIYCTCHTEWTCLPCYAQEVITFNMKYSDKDEYDPIIAYGNQILTYREWYDILHDIFEQMGLDPHNYTSHSLRAGGTSERDLMGYTPTQLQYFGWWKSLDGVLGYIRLSNPDMLMYADNFDQYANYRRRQEGITKEILKKQQDALLDALMLGKKQ